MGELALLLPTLARMTQAGGTVVVIAPPYIPYAPAWQAAGVDLAHLEIVEAAPRDALWAFEQCLRSGACAAVLGWPRQADAHRCGACRWRPTAATAWASPSATASTLANPSPAALRLEQCEAARLARAQMPRRASCPRSAFALATH